MPTPMYAAGKRQYLHKMQMLEMNRKRQEVNTEECHICQIYTT
jgi:hypothetical protein